MVSVPIKYVSFHLNIPGLAPIFFGLVNSSFQTWLPWRSSCHLASIIL